MVTIIAAFMAALCGIALVCRLAVGIAAYSVTAALLFVGIFIALYAVVVQSFISAYIHGLPLPW